MTSYSNPSAVRTCRLVILFNEMAIIGFNEVALIKSNEMAMIKFNEMAMIKFDEIAIITNDLQTAVIKFNEAAMITNEWSIEEVKKLLCGKYCCRCKPHSGLRRDSRPEIARKFPG